jgi:coenzyme Q-binding protein COQ10
MLSDEANCSLPYAPATLFDLAADLERYPLYVPGWISAQIYSRGAEVCYAEQVVGFGLIRMRFRTLARLRRPEQIEVTSEDARFRRFQLTWRFDPESDQHSRVTLRLELELRSALLQSALERAAPGAAAEALRAFERRAGQLFGLSGPGAT